MKLNFFWCALAGALLFTDCTPMPVKQPCGPTNCSGCCDATGTCKSGFELSFCGALGNSCTQCIGAQQCLGGLCQLPQSNGGGSAGGGSAGGGSAGGGTFGGGSAGGGSTGGGSGQMCGSCSGATPICDVSSNFCVGCLTNAHCAGATPACNTFTKTCVPCTSNVHCTGATPICDMSVNRCSVCSATQGCSGATPACDNSVPGGRCVACTSNANCSGATPVCDTTINSCVACTTGQGCSGATPVCDTSVSGGQCVSCLANSHCGGSTPVCNTATRQCVGCLSSTDCSGATPACDSATKSCVRCTATSGCSGATPVCDTSVSGGQCVGCLSSTTCANNSPSTPVCDAATRSCVRCTATTGCSGSTPTCDTSVSGGQCVQCTSNATCATNFPSTPVCNTWTKSCVTCTATSGCSGTTPTCDTSVSGGQCVQCTSNATCATNFPSTPVCNTSTRSCVTCTATSGCSGTTPVCDTSVSGGQCVQCTSSTQCSAPTSQCLTASRVCVQCLSNSNCSGTTPICDVSGAHSCVACLTNANCANPNPICTASKTCGPCSFTSQCASAQNCSSGQCAANSESCTSPQTLSVTGTMLNFRADSTNAVNDVAPLCSGSSGPDLVYRLPLTAAKDVTISVAPVAGNSWNPVLAVRPGTCLSGSPTSCTDAAGAQGTETLTVHNANGDLFIIIDAATSTGGPADVSIVLNAPTPPPANDTCAGATALTFSNFTATASGTLVAATNGSSGPDTSPACSTGALTTGRDVVYSFTLSTAQDVSFSATSQSASFKPVVYLRRQSDCALNQSSADLVCNASASTSSPAGGRAYNLQPGTYVIFVDSADSSEGAFDLAVSLLPPTLPPSNDTCSAPQALTFDGTGRASVSGTLISANNSNLPADPSPTCSTAAKTTGHDVVYAFTLAATSFVRVTVTGTGTPAPTPMIYLRRLTDCANSASGAELGCGLSSTSNFPALAAGDYALWVDNQGTTDGTFDLVVTRAQAPANDLCTAATPLTFTNGLAQDTSSTLSATNQYAGPSGNCGTNSSASSNDVVYSLSADGGTTYTVAVTQTDTTFLPVLYSSTGCPISTVLSCAINTASSRPGAPVGIAEVSGSNVTTTFFYVDGNGISGNYRLDARLGLPPNEVCASARAIQASTVLVDNSIVEANTWATNNYGSGGSTTSSLCNQTGSIFAGKDLVYAFTAPATATYTVTVTPDTGLDPTLAVLDSNCTTTTCLGAVDNGNPGDPETFSLSATQGTTYYIVVDGYAGDTGFFRLDVR